MTRQGKNIFGVVIIALIVGFYFYVTSLNDNVDKKSDTYYNSLYASEERIYNKFLSENEKDVYDIIFKMFKKRSKVYNTTFKELHCVDGNTCNDIISTAFYAVEYDHPEILGSAWYTFVYDKSDKTLQLKLSYATPFAITDVYGEMYIMTVLEKIKEDTADMSDAEKIKYVYEWIGDRAYYDTAFTYTTKNQSAYNAIVNRNAVCSGFAKASAIILNYIGIETYVIAGQSHMWNVVKYKDKYYYYDSTVSACIEETSDSYYDGLIQTKMNGRSLYYSDWNFDIETTNMDFMEGRA